MRRQRCGARRILFGGIVCVEYSGYGKRLDSHIESLAKFCHGPGHKVSVEHGAVHTAAESVFITASIIFIYININIYNQLPAFISKPCNTRASALSLVALLPPDAPVPPAYSISSLETDDTKREGMLVLMGL